MFFIHASALTDEESACHPGSAPNDFSGGAEFL